MREGSEDLDVMILCNLTICLIFAFKGLDLNLQPSKRSRIDARPHLEQLPVELKHSFVVSDVHLFYFPCVERGGEDVCTWI